jgi:hypothetical protein
MLGRTPGPHYLILIQADLLHDGCPAAQSRCDENLIALTATLAELRRDSIGTGLTRTGLFRAALLSGALCVVLATRVAVSFEPWRLKIVQTPVVPISGTVTVDAVSTPGSADLEPPLAVIARLRNDSRTSQRFDIQIDGGLVCRPTVPGAASRRVDCTLSNGWVGTRHHTVIVASSNPTWTLEYLEVATHHGATRSHDLVILPALSHRYGRTSYLWIGLAWLALGALLLVPARLPRRGGLRALYRVGTAVVVLFLALVLVSRFVSPYVILLSPSGFLAYTSLLVAPQLWSVYRIASTRAQETGCSHVASAACALLFILAAFGSVFGGRLADSYHGNYSGFLHISRETFDRNPLLKDRDDVRRSLVLEDPGGYDGQFSYYEVYDPFLQRFSDRPSEYRAFIDAPPYRFGRIGYSLLAKALSADRWQWYPPTMVWLVFLSIVACGILLGLMAVDAGLTPAFAALVVLVPGFWQSLQSGLPEPIAAATLLGGYLCVSRRWWYGGAMLFGLSLLIRETGVLFVLSVAGAALVSERPRDIARFLLLSLGAVCLWRLYVGWMLVGDWGAEAFLFNPHDFVLPFSGIVKLWSTIARGQYYPAVSDLSRAGIWYPVLLVAAATFAAVAAFAVPSAASIAAVCYAVIALSLNFDSMWVQVGNAQRGTFELFVMLALVSLKFRSFGRLARWMLIVFWGFSAAYVFFGAFDAFYIRAELLSTIHLD